MNTEKPFNRYYFSNTECTELEIPRLTICWYQYFSVFSVISVFVSFMVVNNKPLHFVCFAQSIEKNKRKQKKQKKTVIGYKNKTLKTHKTFEPCWLVSTSFECFAGFILYPHTAHQPFPCIPCVPCSSPKSESTSGPLTGSQQVYESTSQQVLRLRYRLRRHRLCVF